MKHEISDSITFQAVCSKGDYHGQYRNNKQTALADAAAHNAKPGCKNHIVKIVKVATEVEILKKDK